MICRTLSYIDVDTQADMRTATDPTVTPTLHLQRCDWESMSHDSSRHGDDIHIIYTYLFLVIWFYV